MNLNDLIAMLQDAEQELGGSAEVRLAIQPSWPFEHSIAWDGASADGVFYIAEGTQLGYLPGGAKEELGW